MALISFLVGLVLGRFIVPKVKITMVKKVNTKLKRKPIEYDELRAWEAEQPTGNSSRINH